MKNHLIWLWYMGGFGAASGSGSILTRVSYKQKKEANIMFERGENEICD